MFHVMNRGSARRTIFDTPSDYRFFLACLARAVRRQEIVVLAYALMRTHFHLFVRSRGGLSTAMQRIQLRHARRFNRLRRRDGPLFRGRFLSKRVCGDEYGRKVVYYIHENPVLARLCDRPEQYRWSSAGLCVQPRRPRWYSMEAMNRFRIEVRPGAHQLDDQRMRARAELVDARLHSRASEDDMPLDAATPSQILDWMRRKAKLADGALSSLPLVSTSALCAAIDLNLRSTTASHTPVPGARTYPTRDLLLAGLLRDVCCCSFREIASKVQRAVSHVRRLVRHHRSCLMHLPAYAAIAAAVVKEGIDFLDCVDG
jgi:REP element-mobilizing transposase RayT